MDFTTRSLKAGIGLEVTGLDLTKEISADTAGDLRKVWHDAGLVLFRNVGTCPDTLLKLSRCFGPLEPHPLEHLRMPGYSELIVLTNRDGAKSPIYDFDGIPTIGRIPWHTDLAFQIVPNAGALLQMVQKVKTGGRTAWLDTALAYEALDEATKHDIDGLEVVFEFCADLGEMRFLNPNGVRVGEANAQFPYYPPIARPLVWNHPESGRGILNICPLNVRSVVGMAQAEGDALLQRLIDHVTQPQFVYEHDWSEGDVVLWDNYRMMHSTTGHPVEEIRIVQRSTLGGSAIVGRVLETAGREAASAHATS